MTTKTQSDFNYLSRGKYMLNKLHKGGWLGAKDDPPSAISRCLTTLLVALRWESNLRYICESLPHETNRLTLSELRNTMANLGYKSTEETVELETLDTRLMPCLFLPASADTENDPDNAYVILGRDEKDPSIFHIFDGESNSIRTHHSDIPINGTAYFFQAIPKEPQGQIQAKGSWFSKIFSRFGALFIQIMMISIMVSILSLSAPIFIMLTYDKIIGAHSTQSLPYFVLGFILVIAIEFYLRNLRTQIIAWFGSRLDYIVGIAVFQRLLFLPASYTERASVSSQVARIKGFEVVRDFFTGPLFLVFLEIPFILITLFAISMIAGDLVLVPLIIIGIFAIIAMVLFPVLKSQISITAHKSSQRQELIIETFSKLRTLKLSHIHDKWLERIRTISGETCHAQFRSSFTASIIESIAHMISTMSAVTIIYFGVQAIWQDQMSVGALVATMILVWRILAPLHSICSAVTQLEQLGNSVAQVDRLMAFAPERNEHCTPEPMKYLEGRVAINHVGLRYNKDTDPVFSNLNMQVKPGELIVIAGKNGTGKSTILKLLNGLYRPQVGTISLDGMDIRQLDPVELRQHIAYLPQKPAFFHGTIAENLRLADPIASDDELKKALIQADAWEEVMELPEGMGSCISEEEVDHLSSSFITHLNLARLYISHSKILLLDELPTGVLKTKSGQNYLKFLQSNHQKRTIFMVSNAPEHFAIADKILFLKEGHAPKVTTPKQIIQLIKTQRNHGKS